MHCVQQNIMIAMSSTSGFCRHLVRIFVDQKSRFFTFVEFTWKWRAGIRRTMPVCKESSGWGPALTLMIS